MNNGRENRNHGSQEEGEEEKEKETLSSVRNVTGGRAMRPLKFFGEG
jgi:hypothetical protein